MVNMFYEYLVEYFINFNVYDGKEMCVFCVFYVYIMFRMDGLGICIICLRWILLYILRLVFFNFNLVLVK